jgi:hypothetical protein
MAAPRKLIEGGSRAVWMSWHTGRGGGDRACSMGKQCRGEGQRSNWKEQREVPWQGWSAEVNPGLQGCKAVPEGGKGAVCSVQCSFIPSAKWCYAVAALDRRRKVEKAGE